MAHQHRQGPAWSAVGVVVVLVFAGFLFAANARISESQGREPRDLPGLVQAELDRAQVAADEVASLRTEVDQLTDQQAASTSPGDTAAADQLAFAAGWVPVTGPGLEVRLSDAPAGAARPDGYTNDDLVVHQQDVQGVMNALWAGGAEAMSLEGQRVVSTSAVRCVGNVLWLQGRLYSPPYVIRAIGNATTMQAALDTSPTVKIYREWADAVGLGWSVTKSDELDLPGYDGAAELAYASPAKQDGPVK
jgi:uncharacterized protein YlxW (UPF0749 family)